MLITEKIRLKWKMLLEHGDIEKIVQTSKNVETPKGIDRHTISKAIATGRMNDTTFDVITKFFAEKAQSQGKKQIKHLQELDGE